MSRVQRDMALTGQPPAALNVIQKLGTALGVGGLLILVLAVFNLQLPNKTLWLSIALSALFGGIVLFSYGAYSDKQAGIKNDGVWFKSVSSRGFLAWIAGLALTGFYIVLYFKAELLGLNTEGKNTGLIALFDPLSKLLSGNPASQWFVYGTLYTIAILGFWY